jgi:3-methylcrotonyl-CoA carboxylase beta subunit
MRIEPRVDTASDGFRARAERVRALCDELAERLARVRLQGPEDVRAKHTARGKLLARERVRELLDPGAELLELSPLAAWGHYDGEVPAAGSVCGIGPVHGRECMLLVNDATVKGGTFYPLTVKKNLRAQRIGEQNRLPCIYLVDSGGAFLPLQSEIFPDREHGGRVFYNQARMSARGTPQLAAVMGSCTAGGAYTPAMAEQVTIVRGSGTVFLAGPPLVKAATGEEVSAEELGGADVHTRMSGLADMQAVDDRDAIAQLRAMVRDLGDAPPAAYAPDAERAPLGAADELLGVLPEPGEPWDPRELLARVLDAGELEAFKPLYGPELVCGYGRFRGWRAGVVASGGPLTARAALKGAHFAAMTAGRGLPLVFLQHLTGEVPGGADEQGLLIKETAKLMREVACAGVPLLTVVVGGAIGPAAWALGGRAMDPRFLWLLPTARVHAADAAAEDASPYASTARMHDDGILDPRALRETLARALAITARSVERTRYRNPAAAIGGRRTRPVP